MKRLLMLMLLCAPLAVAAKDAPPFDPASDPTAQAATFLKGNKLTALSGVKRVAISQFRVEYSVENKAKATSSSSAGWSSSQSDITLIGVSDELRQTITDQLHDQLVAALTEAGIEVVPYETLSQDSRYQSMETIFRRAQEPVGMQSGKSIFVGAYRRPYYLTNDDKHIGLGTALGGFSTVQPQNIEPRIAESLNATVLRVTMAVKFADLKASGGLFQTGSSVKTSEALAWVAEQTQFLFVTPENGRARVILSRTIVMPGDVLTLRDTTSKGEKATETTFNVLGAVLGGGMGDRSTRHYEATANPDKYLIAVTEYGAALESALMAIVKPALAGAASD